jgi:hypothetical protein
MTVPKPDKILEDTFCQFCDKDFQLPMYLQSHVLTEHRGTTAAIRIQNALVRAAVGRPSYENGDYDAHADPRYR